MNDTIARYEKMVEQFPENELARFSLGKALFDAGDFQHAKEQFATALTKKPDWMVVQILVGKCELAIGNKACAKAAFERALQLAIEQSHEGPQMEMEQALAELDFLTQSRKDAETQRRWRILASLHLCASALKSSA